MDIAKILEIPHCQYKALECGHESFANSQLMTLSSYFSMSFSDFFPKPHAHNQENFVAIDDLSKLRCIDGGKL